MFGDIKEVISIHKSKDRKHKGQKDKQRPAKHYTGNKRSSSTNPTTQSGVNSGAPDGLDVPAPQWRPSCLIHIILMKEAHVDKLINNSNTNHYSGSSQTKQHKDKYTQQMKKIGFPHVCAEIRQIIWNITTTKTEKLQIYGM